MALAFYELMSRSFNVCVYPTDGASSKSKYLNLPLGRRLPICGAPIRSRATIFADVLWNGSADTTYNVVPHTGLRLACIILDSDQLPEEMVAIANQRFDAAIVSSPHLRDVARSSGVRIPIGVLPIALDLEPLLSRPRRDWPSQKIRFGSVASFHERKGADQLIAAFIQTFGNRDDVELVIHSNLGFGNLFGGLAAKVDQLGIRNVKLSHLDLAESELIDLIDSFDIFVNCSRGEGYSIGPRQALALGKPLVLSAVGGHLELEGTRGVFLVRADVTVPARYPEIDGRIIGSQRAVRSAEFGQALSTALEFVRSAEARNSTRERRLRAADFSYSRLATSYAEVLNTRARDFRTEPTVSREVDIPPDFKVTVSGRVGSRVDSFKQIERTVVPAYDGGFFSLFNAFVSHLVWDQGDSRCQMVLPDWDVGRLLSRYEGQPIKSFCYGTKEDGNIWTRLFEPLYGLSIEQMNDEELLYNGAQIPMFRHNEKREPLMTYIHAYDLYGTSWFSRWRKQYSRIVSSHVRLRPEFRGEVDSFVETHFRDRFVISAHVRHPSHTVEQPDGRIAVAANYITRIRNELTHRVVHSKEWLVFLATDQDIVVKEFQAAFGENVVFFEDVRRITSQEDSCFYSAGADQRNQEGFQLQHILAQSSQWSTRFAWEVVRDAMVMSRSHMLLHVVSNVSTAVAYLNPNIEMIFCGSDQEIAAAADASRIFRGVQLSN